MFKKKIQAGEETDYENEKILLQDELKKQIGDQEWSPQSSGISIKTGALKLSEMWKKILEGSEAGLTFR